MTTEVPVNAEVQPTAEPQSLMDYPGETSQTPTTVPNDAGVIQTASENTQEAAPWYLTDGVVGQGDKPTYLQDKFKNMGAQAKAFVELETRFGAHKGAPTEYNLDFIKETGVEIDPNQPQFKEFIELSKEENISQSYFQKAISKYIELEKVKTPNMEEERAKLGPDGAEKMNTIRQWAVNTLPADEAQALCYAATSAAFVRALDKLRNGVQPNAIPTDPQMVPKSIPVNTVSQLRQEMTDNYDKYKVNEGYRKSINERLGVATKVESTQL